MWSLYFSVATLWRVPVITSCELEGKGTDCQVLCSVNHQLLQNSISLSDYSSKNLELLIPIQFLFKGGKGVRVRRGGGWLSQQCMEVAVDPDDSNKRSMTNWPSLGAGEYFKNWENTENTDAACSMLRMIQVRWAEDKQGGNKVRYLQCTKLNPCKALVDSSQS